jgi:spore germination protein GerM
MKRKRRKKKKSGLKSFFFLLILVGIAIGFLSLFRQELFRWVSPWLERRGLLEEKRGVTLYFSDREAEHLVGEKREIKKREDIEDEAQEVIRELIRGPRGPLLKTLPSETKLLSLRLDEKGIAKVNFNRSLSRNHPGGSSAEMMTVYSIVNSLVLNFPEIRRVQILMEGQGIETLAGHLSLSQPISPKPDLIQKGGGQMGK